MTITIERCTGGDFRGSGGKPDSSGGGVITTVGPNRVIVWASLTGRDNNATDYQRVTAITGSGLTVNHPVSQDYTYNDSAANASFPVASMHLDIFWALCPSTTASQSWSSTITGDGFVNNSSLLVFTLAGCDPANPIDTDASNFKFASNVSGSASAPSVSGFSTQASASGLLLLMYNHHTGGASPTIPAAPTGPGGAWTLASGQFQSGGGGPSELSCSCAIQNFAAPQSSITVTGATSDNDWGALLMAFRDASAVATPALEPVVVIMQ
jgi:hypothetical protein